MVIPEYNTLNLKERQKRRRQNSRKDSPRRRNLFSCQKVTVLCHPCRSTYVAKPTSELIPAPIFTPGNLPRASKTESYPFLRKGHYLRNACRSPPQVALLAPLFDASLSLRSRGPVINSIQNLKRFDSKLDYKISFSRPQIRNLPNGPAPFYSHLMIIHNYAAVLCTVAVAGNADAPPQGNRTRQTEIAAFRFHADEADSVVCRISTNGGRRTDLLAMTTYQTSLSRRLILHICGVVGLGRAQLAASQSLGIPGPSADQFSTSAPMAST